MPLWLGTLQDNQYRHLDIREGDSLALTSQVILGAAAILHSLSFIMFLIRILGVSLFGWRIKMRAGVLSVSWVILGIAGLGSSVIAMSAVIDGLAIASAGMYIQIQVDRDLFERRRLEAPKLVPYLSIATARFNPVTVVRYWRRLQGLRNEEMQ